MKSFAAGQSVPHNTAETVYLCTSSGVPAATAFAMLQAAACAPMLQLTLATRLTDYCQFQQRQQRCQQCAHQLVRRAVGIGAVRAAAARRQCHSGIVGRVHGAAALECIEGAKGVCDSSGYHGGGQGPMHAHAEITPALRTALLHDVGGAICWLLLGIT
ncbi:hypothetical protein JKP88DRAFT_249988 [Tribonema minus]|uniref:Uncharacterized protein n=1 Tax=Tribonema minus TaxID=303371 RepID=A0A835YJR2_9STRA|nr:hypothetical protein JKP88DRAFT_249988 [Tribonema minus]